ncbi:hypothetical protein A3709_17690 [Halioglobus sp. HI00S01]|uniref:potassium channel family protein n=1 Tax=Halioglobus sp. HI00S01 TaxID=1822214 RepID=UPI0007C301B6|nr:potassium channel family protein [Halioglobus sp. HI00S01]KZX58821.1 hypothetical protein A3709_17690 [Halioglobus sp. HI00S01]
MRRYRDELVLLAGLLTAFALTASISLLGRWSLWSSIVVLCLTTFYYSYTFFHSDNRGLKLFLFLVQAILVIFYFALIYRSFGIIDSATGQTISPEWLDAMYFSVVTWTTLGYGDFRPVHDAKIWVMAEALLGYVFMGIFVAKILYMLRGDEDTLAVEEA